MTDATNHLDVDDERFREASKVLRDYTKKLHKKLTEAEARATRYREQLASRVLGNTLAGEGFANPGRVMEALLADVDPLDQSAVEAWLATNGDDYAKAESWPEEPASEQKQESTPDQPAAEAFAESTQGSLGQPLGEQERFEAFLNATGQGVRSAPTERQHP